MGEITEKVADDAFEDFREFIDTEKMVIKKEHELSQQLMRWIEIIEFAGSLAPKGQAIKDDVLRKIAEIRELIESRSSIGVRVAKEEISLLKLINDDLKNKEWRAIRADLGHAERGERGVLRLQAYELKVLHKLFVELLAKVNILVEITPKDGREKQVQYFRELQRLIRAYEEVFSELYEKEQILNKELKFANREMAS